MYLFNLPGLSHDFVSVVPPLLVYGLETSIDDEDYVVEVDLSFGQKIISRVWIPA